MSTNMVLLVVTAVPAVIWAVSHIDNLEELTNALVLPEEKEEHERKLIKAQRRHAVYKALYVVSLIVAFVTLALLYKPLLFTYLFG